MACSGARNGAPRRQAPKVSARVTWLTANSSRLSSTGSGSPTYVATFSGFCYVAFVIKFQIFLSLVRAMLDPKLRLIGLRFASNPSGAVTTPSLERGRHIRRFDPLSRSGLTS